MPDFKPFDKIARLTRNCVITEKIDGTNASIYIGDDGEFLVGSRTRWITPTDDNYGFAKWAERNKTDLLQLGPGHHFGEWWGNGIQRNYGLKEKHFSLFNTSMWADPVIGEYTGTAVRPACCGVVPVLYAGVFSEEAVADALNNLATYGSKAAPGFLKPEGIVIWHEAARLYFKKTIEKDAEPKGKVLVMDVPNPVRDKVKETLDMLEQLK